MTKRTRRCKCCRVEFRPSRQGQSACSIECAEVVGRSVTAKADARAKRDRSRETKQALEKIKKRSEWIQEAQAAFNGFIRTRDKDLPCICCGRWGQDEGWKPGGSWDAGHFLGVGAYPELRFVEDNCHKQLKSCNAGSGKYARKGRTVAQEYRGRLIEKIGIERVEYLEGPHDPKKYTIDELKAIKAEYIAKRKTLEGSK